MTDEEFEAAVASAQRRAQEREAEPPQEDEPLAPAPADTDGRPRRSLLTGLSGAVTAGAVLIALITIAGQIFCVYYHKPGPGVLDIAGQCVLALLAVFLQRKVDRRTGARRRWAALGVLVAALLSFGVFWWAWLLFYST